MQNQKPGEAAREPGVIEITDDPEAAQQIERELLASLARINRQSANLRQSFAVKDRSGQLIAGLTCSTAYGWLHVEALWVDDPHCGQGFGRNLMNAAETFGGDEGCHSVWLDTSNPGAAAFYQALGYTVFGELKNGEGNDRPEHRRWFLQRRL